MSKIVKGFHSWLWVCLGGIGLLFGGLVYGDFIELSAVDSVDVQASSSRAGGLLYGAEDLWMEGAVPFPDAVNIKFSSAATTLWIKNYGTLVSDIEVTLEGLDSDRKKQILLDTIDASSSEALPGTWTRVHKASLKKRAGTYLEGAVVLIGFSATFDSSTTLLAIPSGAVEGFSPSVTIPRQWEATLYSWDVQALWSGGPSSTITGQAKPDSYAAANIGVLYRKVGETEWRIYKDIILSDGGMFSLSQEDPRIIPPRSDLKVAANITGSAMSINSRCIFNTRRSVTE